MFAAFAPIRYSRLDALRGAAMVWMTLYHFCFDLHYFRWIRQDFYSDPFWTWQRSLIVTLFLLCTGAGQAIALHQGQSWQRFGRRWAQIAGCALLVSAGSFVMYPKSFIYFGVLHAIAIMLIVVRLTAHWGAWLWLLGAVAIAMKFIASYALNIWPILDFLNSKPWNWLGLISVKPMTEDYVPLIPWLGIVWWGMAATQYMLRKQPSQLSGALPAGTRTLAWMGRWSLLYYMLHQPVMIGLLEVVQRFR